MAALSCGSDAETFGSLMMLASGVVASSPSSARASRDPLVVGEEVGEQGEDPAGERDVARSPPSTPAAAAKAWMIGRNEYVASAGASSVWV